MKIKYYLRGLATGMVLAAILMTAAGGKQQKMTDEQIRESAEKLGMVMPDQTLASAEHDKTEGSRSAEETASSGQESKAESSEVQEIETKASESSKTPETPESETESSEENKAQGSETAASETKETEESQTAGSEAQDAQKSQTESSEAQDTQESQTQSPEVQETQESSETAESLPESSESQGNSDISVLTIRAGYSSTTVSNLLAEMGLVENAKEFDRFLSNNGYDKQILVGSFEIPSGSSEEEIAKIITTHRKF